MRGAGPESRSVRRAIDEGRIPPVWLWTGAEEFLKDELFGRLVARVLEPELAGMNLERFRCKVDKVEAALSTARTLPMLGSRRVVLLRDVEAIGRDLDPLLAYVAAPAAETALVLMLDEIGATWTESKERERIRDRILAAGAVGASLTPPGEEQIREWIRLRFRDAGKTCAEETAAEILEACRMAEGETPSLYAVAPEVDKIVLVTGSREEVRNEDLEVIGRKAAQELLGAIPNLLDRRDLAGALRALDGALVFRDNTEIRVVARLAWHFDRKGTRRDSTFSGPEVVRALRLLAHADRMLKSGGKDSRVVIEQTLAAICRG